MSITTGETVSDDYFSPELPESVGDTPVYSSFDDVPAASELRPTDDLLSAENEVRLAKDIEAGTTAETLLKICAMTEAERDQWRDKSIDSLALEILRARHNHSKDAELTAKAQKEATQKTDGFIQLARRQGPENDEGVIELSPETIDAFERLVILRQLAFERFWTANQGLVWWSAQKRRGCGMPWKELIDEVAVGGLLPAILKFNYSRGNKFSTYAVPWLGQAATRAAEEHINRELEVDGVTSSEHAAVIRTTDELWQTLGHYPTAQEVAKKLDIKLSTVKRVLESPGGSVSLDDLTDRDYRLTDSSSDPEAASHEIVVQALDNLLASCLSEQRATVVRLRLGLGQPGGIGLEFQEIERRLGHGGKWANDNYTVALDILRYVAGRKMHNPPNKRQHAQWGRLALLRDRYGPDARALVDFLG